MEYIVYTSKLTQEELGKFSILIENCEIENGVKIERFVRLKNSKICKNSYISSYTQIENSTIKEGVIVKSSYILDSFIGKDSTVGPFAHIHTNSVVKSKCRIGNFVEIKNSIISNGSKLAHLTYVGDAQIGEDCNIGCGVIFCNYNGEIKQRSLVGDRVFIGSNVNVIAPVKIGDGAYIAAGSTVNIDVKENEFAIARARQINKTNFDNPYLKNKK